MGNIICNYVSGNCIDDDYTTEGAVPAVGPNGEIYVSWAGPEGLVFDKSLDGGDTWGTDIFISDIPGGWAFNVPGWPVNPTPPIVDVILTLGNSASVFGSFQLASTAP